MIEEILLNFILLAFVYWLGWRMGSRWMLLRLSKFVLERRKDLPQILKELDMELDQLERKPDAVPEGSEEIVVEREGEQFYLYRKSNHQFLGQGPTLMEALDSVKKRFPDESFWGGVERELADKWGLKKEIERQNS